MLIFVCTFDPIPLDLLYEFMPFWDFNYINQETDREVFSRIGLEDRNLINVMGSMILFVLMFLISQIIFQALNPLRPYHRYIRRITDFLTLDTAYRTLFLVFFLEAYLDL